MNSKYSKEIPSTLPAFLWMFLKNKKKYLVGFVICIFIWALELSISPYLLGKIINIITMENTAKDKIVNILLGPAIIYVSLSVVININLRVYNYLFLKLLPRVKADITNSMYCYLVKHSHNFFVNNHTGTLTKKIYDMSSGFEQLLTISNEHFYTGIFALIVGCITLYFSVSPIFALILLIWGILFVILTYLAAKRCTKYAEKLSTAESKLNGVISDSINNILTTKLFCNLNFEIKRNLRYLNRVIKKDRQLQWQNIFVFAAQGLGLTILLAGMMTALICLYIDDKVNAGDFALVLSLSLSFGYTIDSIGEALLRFSKEVGTCQQALSFIKIPHEITDKKDAKDLVIKKAAVEFKSVDFQYISQKPLFTNLSIKIKPGEKVGLVGYSGGGKTTLVKLLLRFIEPAGGEILIDKQNISDVTEVSLRNSIATIPQDTELFHRSIIENIRSARIDASDKEVIDAAKKAKCHDFIMELPKNYKSLVGEKGVKLSGGQRQRISIARAFLKNAPILILDEATSSLDSITERNIQAGLHSVMQGRTTIVIAHRLSTLKDMDRIIVFEKGAIIEQGKVQTLLKKKNSTFKKLWQIQSEEFHN